MIVAGIFDLGYAATSLSIFSADTREGHLELSKRVFGYMNKYPKQGHDINLQPLTINMEYKRVELKIFSGNQYSYFQEEIGDRFPDPLFDSLDLNIFVD